MTEDLSMIAVYREWLEARGCRVVLGSPFNLHDCAHGRRHVRRAAVDLLIRHYKTDWWGRAAGGVVGCRTVPRRRAVERPAAIACWRRNTAGRVSVVNPFGTVVSQNKLSMAFMWEERRRFSAAAQRWNRALHTRDVPHDARWRPTSWWPTGRTGF